MKNHIRFILSTLILCTSIGFLYMHIFISSEKNSSPDKEFPDQISNWTSEEVVYNKEMLLRELSPDKIVYKRYSNANTVPPITMFMAYYNTLEKADLSHSPVVCFAGQGWEIDKHGKKEVLIGLPDTLKIKVNHMIQRKLGTTMITLFWYQTAKHAFSNRGIQKITLFFDKLFGKSGNNAFFRLTLVVPPGKSIAETNIYLLAFLRDLYPEIKKLFI